MSACVVGRLKNLEEEFYSVVDVPELCQTLQLEEEIVDIICVYWQLKRKVRRSPASRPFTVCLSSGVPSYTHNPNKSSLAFGSQSDLEFPRKSTFSRQFLILSVKFGIDVLCVQL